MPGPSEDGAAAKARLDEQFSALYPAHLRDVYSYAYYRVGNHLDDAGALSAPHTTETLVEDREDLNRILSCVQQLPDDRREALIMRFALGMDNGEIARALGRTDGATKVLIHRALRQLEELVQTAEATG